MLELYQLGGSPLCVQGSLLEFVWDSTSGVFITNPSGQTCQEKRGMELGTITPAIIQEMQEPPPVSCTKQMDTFMLLVCTPASELN